MKKIKRFSLKMISLQARINMIAIISLLMVSACNPEPPPPPDPEPDPTITSISPDSGLKGDVIAIKGTSFGTDASIISVTFNDKDAQVQNVTDTLLKAIVPVDASTGLVKVSIGDSIEITGPEFTYLESLPNITSTSIDNGTFGDLMLIKGSNFGEDISVVTVSINGKEVTIRNVANWQLNVIVPDTTGTGLVRVTVDGAEVEGPGFTYGTPDPADVFTESLNIGEGSRPAIAIDYNARIIHLVYATGATLYYRQGDLDGNFGAAEVVHNIADQNSIIRDSPTLVLDENNVPHVAIVEGGPFLGKTIHYANRIGGSWSSYKVLDGAEVADFYLCVSPFMAVENNTVYMTALMIRGNPNFMPSNVYIRIDDVDTAPVVSKKTFTNNFATAFPYLKDNGELWVHQSIPGGGAWHAKWVVQQIDKTTMEPTGDNIEFVNGLGAEQIRWLYDGQGEIHAASATWRGSNPKMEGWYQSLARKTAGLQPLNFKTTNLHANGGIQPVRDLVAADRMYVVYWNGVNDTDKFGKQGENPFGCTVENQLNFMRVDNGVKVNERRRVTSRTAGIHGTSYRAGPAAAAHPDGGMIVVFPECESKERDFSDRPSQLYFTHIGKL